VNKALPPSVRIRVWLGEPPIDWSKITTARDLTQMAQRDRYPAELIKSHILAEHKKALVIYGASHFTSLESLRSLVEESRPQSFFVVMPFHGYTRNSASLEEFVRTWRAQMTSLGGTNAGPVLLIGQTFTDQGDALLYLGPVENLTQSPTTPDLYLDEAFRKEINRRSIIVTGSPLPVDIPQVSPTFLSK